MKKKSRRIKRLWDGITADMMTEEETGIENNYIRHRQSWRSTRFNKFMEQLDEDKCAKSLAKQRETGDTIERSPPSGVKSWMVAEQETEERNEDEGDLLSNSSSVEDN